MECDKRRSATSTGARLAIELDEQWRRCGGSRQAGAEEGGRNRTRGRISGNAGRPAGSGDGAGSRPPPSGRAGCGRRRCRPRHRGRWLVVALGAPAAVAASPAPRHRRARPRATSGSRSAGSATSRPRSAGGSRTTTSPCSRRRTPASPATSRTPGSATPASPRPSLAGTASSSCAPTGPTASSTTTTSSTRSASAPLQQYLIEFPDGRLQALGIAWDTRPRDAGRAALVSPLPGPERDPPRRAALDGHQPELELHVRRVPLDGRPEELRRQDPALQHRLRRGQRRLRGLPRARLAITSRGHGRRATGGAWTTARRGLPSRWTSARASRWTISAETGNAQRTPPGRPAREVEMCGRCHARRGQFSEDYAPGRPLGDTHRVALLEDRLYHPDGQIRDEVYEYGSFLQSKMFHRGVTCSDCHDPHSGKLRAPGSQVCLDCHAAQKYESGGASLPPGGLARRRLPRLPHADHDLHGGRPAPRPQLPRPAAGPLGEARRAERLHAMPRRAAGRVGGQAGRGVVRARAARVSALRRGARGGLDRGPRVRGSCSRPWPRRRSAGHRAGERARAPGPLAERWRPRRRPRGPEGRRPARAARGGERRRGRRPHAPHRAAGAAARRPRPRRAHGSGARAGRRAAGSADGRAANGARPGPRGVHRRRAVQRRSPGVAPEPRPPVTRLSGGSAEAEAALRRRSSWTRASSRPPSTSRTSTARPAGTRRASGCCATSLEA